MILSLDKQNPRAQQTTVLMGLLLGLSAFIFFSQLQLRETEVVFVGMTVMIGKRIATMGTVGLTVILNLVFLASGLLQGHMPGWSDALYHTGTVPAVGLALIYIILYFSTKNRQGREMV